MDERVVRRERGERASGEILETEFRKAMEQSDRLTNPDERDAARMKQTETQERSHRRISVNRLGQASDRSILK